MEKNLDTVVQTMVNALLLAAAGTKDAEEPMLSPAQAAERLGISSKTVREEIAAGRLKAFRFGARCIRVRAADLRAYIQARETKPLVWQARAQLG